MSPNKSQLDFTTEMEVCFKILQTFYRKFKIQGDHGGFALPFVDCKTKVPLL